ncbi:hypothetical protein G6F22_019073 [Rhizopus arrhizus]|nr:hypothetical protein G6F22_019073 [Rhizopus arrhizus]
MRRLLAGHSLLSFRQFQGRCAARGVLRAHQVLRAASVGDAFFAAGDALVDEGRLPVQRGRSTHQGQGRGLAVLLGGQRLPLGGIALARQLAPQVDLVAHSQLGGIGPRDGAVAVQVAVARHVGAAAQLGDQLVFGQPRLVLGAPHPDRRGGQVVVARQHGIDQAVQDRIIEITPPRTAAAGAWVSGGS